MTFSEILAVSLFDTINTGIAMTSVCTMLGPDLEADQADMNADRAIAPNSKNFPQFAARAVAALLWTLTLLFSLRVIGQAVQRCWPQSFLPAFSAFQGSQLPYPLLLSAQVVILALMARASLRAGAGTLSAGPRQRRFLLGIGFLYMTGSVTRVLIGMALPAAPAWFTAWIPAFFHLVLASFVTTVALHVRDRVTDSVADTGARK